MKIWAFCVFMPQKLQDMSSFLGFGGNSALLLSISIGVATRKEFPESTFNDLVKISDKRMYQDKDNYYQSCGIERRKG